MSVQWTPDYSVGNALLDQQHQELLVICAEIDELTRDASAGFSDKFHEILNRLIKYAERHFRDEEQLLEAHDFPELIIHRRSHDEYFNELSSILYNAIHGKLELERLKSFTSEWWINHILHSDLKYKPYFNQH